MSIARASLRPLCHTLGACNTLQIVLPFQAYKKEILKEIVCSFIEYLMRICKTFVLPSIKASLGFGVFPFMSVFVLVFESVCLTLYMSLSWSMHVFVLRDDVHKDFLCVWLAPFPGHLSLCSPSLYALSGHLVHPITRHLWSSSSSSSSVDIMYIFAVDIVLGDIVITII